MPDNDASPDRDAAINELHQTLGQLERLLTDDPAPRPMSARAALELQARQAGAPQPQRRPPATTAPIISEQAAPVASEPAAPLEDSRDLQLLIRFVTGALILAGETLTERARRWEAAAPRDGAALAGGAPLDQASALELARYWTLGLLAQSRRSGVTALRSALNGSEGLATSAFDLANRATSAIFLRPLRRPLEKVVRRAQVASRDWIEEGWREEQLSRWIAQNGAPEILDDIIGIFSRNPELAALVRKQINQQSMSVAASVVESGRKLSVAGDDMAENFARWLLRRGRRAAMTPIETQRELPPELAINMRLDDDADV